MVFTAIVYSAFSVFEHKDVEGKLRTVTFFETATAAAGGETAIIVPSTNNIAQIHTRFRNRHYRILSWNVWGDVLGGATKLAPYWYAGGNFIMYKPSQTMVDNECFEMVDGGQWPLFASTPATPAVMGTLGVSALVQNDVINNIVTIEVID